MSQAMKLLITEQDLITITSNHYERWLRRSFHMIGKGVCLVILWPHPSRCDKPWNYIALEIQRYTKHIFTMGNLYGRVENVWGIPFLKRMEQKYHFLDGLFYKYVLHCERLQRLKKTTNVRLHFL